MGTAIIFDFLDVLLLIYYDPEKNVALSQTSDARANRWVLRKVCLDESLFVTEFVLSSPGSPYR